MHDGVRKRSRVSGIFIEIAVGRRSRNDSNDCPGLLFCPLTLDFALGIAVDLTIDMVMTSRANSRHSSSSSASSSRDFCAPRELNVTKVRDSTPATSPSLMAILEMLGRFSWARWSVLRQRDSRTASASLISAMANSPRAWRKKSRRSVKTPTTLGSGSNDCSVVLEWERRIAATIWEKSNALIGILREDSSRKCSETSVSALLDSLSAAIRMRR